MTPRTSLPVNRVDVSPSIPATAAIPGGRFLMGDAHGRPDEAPVHAVVVAPFRMATTPVTVRQYGPFLAVAAAPPPWWDDPDFRDPDQPVVGVSFHDAVAFAAWLSTLTGEPWRLPTEAEWERAARGGLEGASTAWGARLPDGEVPHGPLRGPWRVGRGTPNRYGLYDMGTIVHEWCADVYRSYGIAAVATEKGPASSDGPPPGGAPPPERRASRGGSWRHRQRWSSPAARSSLPPAFRYADYGFRVVVGA